MCIGDVGGTLGLFIGGSLLTFFEVIDLCVLHSPFKVAKKMRETEDQVKRMKTSKTNRDFPLCSTFSFGLYLPISSDGPSSFSFHDSGRTFVHFHDNFSVYLYVRLSVCHSSLSFCLSALFLPLSPSQWPFIYRTS